MHLALDGGASCVRIDLRATGPLAVLGHDPTLTARPGAFAIDVVDAPDAPDAAAAPVDVSFEARFAVDAIEPPSGIPASDRVRMRENMLSRDVLDAARYPAVVLRARYSGTLEGGTLAGDLVVRGVARPLAMPVRVRAEADAFVVSGRWEGRLSDLGVKPFKALLGALRLEDRVVLQLQARFVREN